MARKRSYRRTSTRRRKAAGTKVRRRRVGATALNFSVNSPLVKWGSVALGYFIGDKLTAPLVKMIGDKVDPKIVAGAEVGLGFLLAMKKGKKNMLTVVGGGLLLGAGVKSAMQAFGLGGIGPYGRIPVIAGAGPYGRVPVIGKRHLGNYSPSASLNGYSPSGTINSSKIMGTVDGSSGITRENAGSNMMN